MLLGVERVQPQAVAFSRPFEVDDQPGGMLSVLERLSNAGVNVYGHLFTGRWGDRATFSFVVDDPAKARAALEQK